MVTRRQGKRDGELDEGGQKVYIYSCTIIEVLIPGEVTNNMINTVNTAVCYI